jgi:3',5'-cyclic AMP phosphodiesterase CpdA
VPVILHLSDVHLGRAERDEVADDYKGEFVPLEERTNRYKILRWTLEALQEVVPEQPLDAVVVSGDITVANREDGFEQFEDLLGGLGELRPTNDRVVVVPGNHDVTWRTPPSSPERYEYFLKHVREAGYVTPLLDGIDIDSDGKRIGDDKLTHHVVADDGSWVILPVNSSNYSGSREPLNELTDDDWEELLKWASSNVGANAPGQLERIRVNDAARVSPGQLQALNALLTSAAADASPLGLPLRIAVIHHHLLPVSPREEVKSYESITNLGLVRNFLRDNDIGVVLHGHKHREYVYKDHVYPPEGLLAGEPHEVLVLAGATIGTVDWDQTNIARLIRIDSAQKARQVSLAEVAGKEAGGALDPPSYERVPLWRRSDSAIRSGSPEVVLGRDFDETYARVRSLFAAVSRLTHVVCCIENAASVDKLPEGYPEIPDVAEETRQQWYDGIVAWWQKTDSSLRERLHFTHGSRIVRPDVDQIDSAADALRADSSTTRAVITLLDPAQDRVGQIEHKYPAFCLIQLVVRDEGKRRLLDCIGYFRKQEMRYWWPVNVGELRHVQKLVLSHLGGGKSEFEPGAIWTVTTLAVDGTTVPRVAVPAIDRIFDDDEGRLWSMAYAVAWDGMADRKERVAELLELLDELVPDKDFDPDGVPVAREGLSYVAGELQRLGKHHPGSPASDLAKTLQTLYRANRDYNAQTAAKVDPAVHTAWRDEVVGLVEEARGLLDPITNETTS